MINNVKKEKKPLLKTRDRIMLTALMLFNENTATAISTNHIAAEMDISPGNLYYYFKNKEEIIRDIYKKLAELADDIWYQPELGHTEKGMVDYLQNLASHMYEFRFFYLELNVILKNDSLLKDQYVERSEKIIVQMMTIFSDFNEKGIMKTFDSEREKKYMTRNVWTIGQMWMTYSTIECAEVTPKIINDGVWQMFTVAERLFTKRSKKKIESMLLDIFPL